MFTQVLKREQSLESKGGVDIRNGKRKMEGKEKKKGKKRRRKEGRLEICRQAGRKEDRNKRHALEEWCGVFPFLGFLESSPGSPLRAFASSQSLEPACLFCSQGGPTQWAAAEPSAARAVAAPAPGFVYKLGSAC